MKDRWSPWIIGLYDGGAEFDCGVYHPAGACMMRSEVEHDENSPRHGTPYRFCFVCRYILIDAIDPLLHPEADREYAEYYPL